MARTIEQINAAMQELELEKAEVVREQAKAWRIEAADRIQKLNDAGLLPSKIKEACTGTDGTFNPRRTFAIRG